MAGISEYSLPRPAFDAPVKLLIVVAPFYREVADMLIAGAKAEAAAAGAEVDVVEVPGALEIGPAIALAARLSSYDGYVALGCVIRGATSHYETVCAESAHAVTLLSLQGHLTGNGILTVENAEQALERADPARMNKGAGAAAAALHLIALARGWGRKEKGVGFISGLLAKGGESV